jgi:hypothetical protein
MGEHSGVDLLLLTPSSPPKILPYLCVYTDCINSVTFFKCACVERGDRDKVGLGYWKVSGRGVYGEGRLQLSRSWKHRKKVGRVL